MHFFSCRRGANKERKTKHVKNDEKKLKWQNIISSLLSLSHTHKFSLSLALHTHTHTHSNTHLHARPCFFLSLTRTCTHTYFLSPALHIHTLTHTPILSICWPSIRPLGKMRGFLSLWSGIKRLRQSISVSQKQIPNKENLIKISLADFCFAWA